MKKQKRNAVIALIVMIAIFLGAGYLSLFGVGEFQEGSIHDVKLGLDLAGGVSITYQAVGDKTPSAEDMDDTVRIAKEVIGA